MACLNRRGLLMPPLALPLAMASDRVGYGQDRQDRSGTVRLFPYAPMPGPETGRRPSWRGAAPYFSRRGAAQYSSRRGAAQYSKTVRPSGPRAFRAAGPRPTCLPGCRFPRFLAGPSGVPGKSGFRGPVVRGAGPAGRLRRSADPERHAPPAVSPWRGGSGFRRPPRSSRRVP
jgi:hypothetical protein